MYCLLSDSIKRCLFIILGPYYTQRVANGGNRGGLWKCIGINDTIYTQKHGFRTLAGLQLRLYTLTNHTNRAVSLCIEFNATNNTPREPARYLTVLPNLPEIKKVRKPQCIKGSRRSRRTSRRRQPAVYNIGALESCFK